MGLGMYILAIGFGIGFGFFVQKAGICFAHGIGEIFVGRSKRILKIFLVIFIISNLGFTVSAMINPELGLKPIGEIRGYGFYNLMAGIIFGAGIFISGGCILGSLRQLGEGNLMYLIVILSFIPGMALVVYVINPLLSSGYDVQKNVLPSLIGVNPIIVACLINILAVIAFVKLNKKYK